MKKAIQQRPLSIGDIEYFYVPMERPQFPAVIFPPEDFENGIFEMVKRLPKNLIQLNDPFVNYGISKKTQTDLPHRFSIFYPDSIDTIIRFNPYKLSLKIFFVHPDTPALMTLIEKLLNEFSPVFFINVKDPEQPIAGYEKISLLGVADLLEKLQAMTEILDSMFAKIYPKHEIKFSIDLPVTDYHRRFNPPSLFKAAQTNFFTLNQNLGNGWKDTLPDSSDAREETKRILKKGVNDTYRLKIIFDQIERFNELEIVVIKSRDIKFPNAKFEWFSPLVLIVPFNFPTLGKVMDPSIDSADLRALEKLLTYEQAINYNFYKATDETTPKEMMEYARFAVSRARYLDGVGYLHASFTNSPVVRFPQLGNSIKRDLSFFKPEVINAKKMRRSNESIAKFGRKLASLILPENFAQLAFEFPRQIVAITDLPIEWLVYENLNLCFTHDVTRLPETPYGGLLQSYTIHSNIKFSIQKDILSRTLVLLGANTDDDKDQEFKEYFKQIEELSKVLKFRTHRCTSVNDMVHQITEHQPDFLIIDCHGGFDSKTSSSYLVVNGEKIYPADIVRHQISAPLVFLSACHTNPNYGYLNKLADAFFEAGCLAITATYFPISIKSGTNIYLRILNNLVNAAKLSVHKNWLEFVSHVIRTSFFKDVLYNTMENVSASTLDAAEKTIVLEALNKLNQKTSLHMMRLPYRLDINAKFWKEIESICPRKFIDHKVIPEFAFYTNMGRGDLIRFECWEDEFYRLNNLTRDQVT